MRQGLGRRLVRQAIDWAGPEPLWLTTYAHLSWNRPFYERAVAQHLQIGLKALDLLRTRRDTLHSRKLRSFDEPPFR
jgi:GNAT superfamily N-acetyltransferase